MDLFMSELLRVVIGAAYTTATPRVGGPTRLKPGRHGLREFISAGGREQIIAGTDAGSPFNLHSPLVKDIRNLHRAGLTPMEAIQVATLRPAQMHGVAHEVGAVSPGSSRT